MVVAALPSSQLTSDGDGVITIHIYTFLDQEEYILSWTSSEADLIK